MSLDYSSIPNVFPKSPSKRMYFVMFVPFLFYSLGPRPVFGKFRREILARNYRGGWCWLIGGSYKHGMAIITPGDCGEKERVKTTVGKIVIYWMKEELRTIGKNRWSMTSWKLAEGNVEQLVIRGSPS